MDSTLYTLLGGAIGSLLTIAIKNIVGWLREDKTFHQSLQKEYYTRSLDTAEKTIAQFNIVISHYSIIAIQHETRRHPDTWIYSSFYDNSLSKLVSENSQKGASEYFNAAHSLPLYFEVDTEDYWNSNPIRDIILSASSIAIIEQRILEQLSFRESLMPNEQALFDQDLFSELANRLIHESADIVSKIEKYKKGMIAFLEDIRKQMQSKNRSIARIR